MESKHIKIIVLMSVYNGHKYLREQLDSILSQEDVDLHLLVRDDGSKDNSVEILEEYALRDKRVEVIAENNIGCVASFSKLVEIASQRAEYEYFAFSDQDDVWLPNKLLAGVSRLEMCNEEEKKKPLLYFCNMMVADENAKPLFPFIKYQLKVKRAYMLMANYTAGCTVVFNRKMSDTFVKSPVKNPALHDRWMVLIALFFGNLIYDHTCYIKYRQHINNVVGVHNQLSFISRWKEHLSKYFMPYDNTYIAEAKAFMKAFQKDLSNDDILLITTYTNYRNSIKIKCKMLFDKDFYPSSPIIQTFHVYINHIVKILFGRM